MKKILIFILVILLLTSVNADLPKTYEINMYYAEGNFSVENISIQLDDNSFANIPGAYTGEIIANDGTLLDMFIFDIPSFAIAEDFERQGNIIFYNESSFTLYAPYYENTNKIILYNSEYEEILEINVGQFSIDYLDEDPSEGINQSDSEKNNYQTQEDVTKSISDYWWVLLIILIILIGIFIRSLKKK
jgi:hypothetical protein